MVCKKRITLAVVSVNYVRILMINVAKVRAEVNIATVVRGYHVIGKSGSASDEMNVTRAVTIVTRRR